jgi:RimJ/RimL family protein N-acetyltransferase
MILDYAERLYDVFSDPEAVRYWNGPDKSREDAEERVRRMQAHWDKHGYGDWALIDKNSDAMIGFCGLHHISGMDEVNLGFLIAPSFWGVGLATEAAMASLQFGFNNAGLALIVGTTALTNSGAIKVLQKCGMSYWKEIARNGARSVFRITRGEWPRSGP